ncbi:MAG TPA: TetR family transcriptional regulator [Acidimicrobiales bacterium]|nr:TetR family transcriptional regulator [Acidimicrobiales bacterium]
MSEPVKRAYDNAGRRARSEETRERILDAARRLMTANGYRATTIADIARTAEVHLDSIYELVGRKPALLRELIERAISGSDRPVGPQDRGYVRAMQAEPDPARKLSIYAAAVRDIQIRMAPLLVALRDAASTEPEARAVWQEIGDRRARNMRDLVRGLGPEGTLRPGLSVDEAADVLWATAAADVFLLLTVERGWSADAYERWLADTWRRLLLPDSRRRRPPDRS